MQISLEVCCLFFSSFYFIYNVLQKSLFSEDIEFPEGEEALPNEAESLIIQLLEKNPAHRLGTLGGAQQVCLVFFIGFLSFVVITVLF